MNGLDTWQDVHRRFWNQGLILKKEDDRRIPILVLRLLQLSLYKYQWHDNCWRNLIIYNDPISLSHCKIISASVLF